MDIDQFEVIWTQQDKKLDRAIQLNQSVLMKLNLEEANHHLKRPLWSEWITSGMTVLFACYLLTLSFLLINAWQFSLPGFMAATCSIALVVFSLRRISSMRKAMDFSLPVSTLQIHLSEVQIKKLKYARYELILGICAVILMWPIVLYTGFEINIYQRYEVLVIALLLVAVIGLPITLSYERSYQRRIKRVQSLLNELS